MAENRRLRKADQPVTPVVLELGVDAVLLSWQDSLPLALVLVADPRWAVVQIEGHNLLFIRATGDQENLAYRSARLLQEEDPAALVARHARTDKFIDAALLPVGQSLATAGLFDQALVMFQTVVEKLPDDDRVWRHLGYAFGARGSRRQRSGEAGFAEDFAAAERCFEKARLLNPQATRAQEPPVPD
jgi:tetratricopeptide (TPR) repeat protein